MVEEVIRPALAAGKTVLCDRYLLANVVYQGHAGRFGRADALGARPGGYRRPDARTDHRAGHARRGGHRSHGGPWIAWSNRAGLFHARVRQGFLAEAARRPGEFVVVDATARWMRCGAGIGKW